MRVLFDLGHPAHFHLFKHAMAELRADGHGVEILAHQKDCLPDLLDAAGLSYHLIPREGGGLRTLAGAAMRSIRLAVRLARREPIDLMVGTSIAVGPAARMTGAISAVFEEDDAAVIPLFAKLSYGPAHYVVTPRCLAFEAHGRKHLTYPGYQELAYLHPARFQPDAGIRRELGVADGERYFLVRLVALRAHHDVGERGLSPAQARRVVERLAGRGTVFVSSEGAASGPLGARPLPTPPERMLDVLASADLVVGDSQTMAAEAAVLGTPALRCNTFVGRLRYLDELEHRYGLTVGIRPEQFDRVLAQLDEWLAAKDLRRHWQRKRRAMLADCVDLTDWMLALFHRLAARRAAARSGAAADGGRRA